MAVPEDIGTLSRRARLMAAAMLKIASLQVSQPRAYGTPLGDGSGLEDVVAVIRPLFAREPSLTRWVAIRGALLFLDMACKQPSVKAEILVAMGLQADEETVRLAPGAAPLPPQVVANVVGVFHSLAMRLDAYDRVSKMSVDEVNADPFWKAVNQAVALDYIAWTSTALCRVGWVDVPAQMPEPGALETPGWYADPLWAKAERFWDGTDWTSRMKTVAGGRQVEVSQPLS
ncbi:MAG: DUF2510 domain-containing protein [Streptosporangiaceae bacterium]|jgi:hypothetical protein